MSAAAGLPNYANGAPTCDPFTLATANTNFDGTGTIVTAATGVAGGKRINRASVALKGTGASTVVNWFESTDGGTTKRFLFGTKLTSVAVGATQDAAQTFEARLVGKNLVDANHVIYAAVYATADVHGSIDGAKYTPALA